MFTRLFLFVFALILSGCATSRGFNRGELRQELNGPVTVDDRDISQALEVKAQLPKPFKLGVYFQEPQGRGATTWRWSGEDKEKILSLADQLKSTGEISDVFAISDALVTGTDLKSLRLAAAKHGADALLVVSGVNDVDTYNNNFGWTYIAIVTALFVPASKTDDLFMARAVMWDVRNEFLYMTAESEAVKKQTRPAAFNSGRELIDEAKVEAVDKLRAEIAAMATGLSKRTSAASN